MITYHEHGPALGENFLPTRLATKLWRNGLIGPIAHTHVTAQTFRRFGTEAGDINRI